MRGTIARQAFPSANRTCSASCSLPESIAAHRTPARPQHAFAIVAAGLSWEVGSKALAIFKVHALDALERIASAHATSCAAALCHAVCCTIFVAAHIAAACATAGTLIAGRAASLAVLVLGNASLRTQEKSFCARSTVPGESAYKTIPISTISAAAVETLPPARTFGIAVAFVADSQIIRPFTLRAA